MKDTIKIENCRLRKCFAEHIPQRTIILRIWEGLSPLLRIPKWAFHPMLYIVPLPQDCFGICLVAVSCAILPEASCFLKAVIRSLCSGLILFLH